MRKAHAAVVVALFTMGVVAACSDHLRPVTEPIKKEVIASPPALGETGCSISAQANGIVRLGAIARGELPASFPRLDQASPDAKGHKVMRVITREIVRKTNGQDETVGIACLVPRNGPPHTVAY